MFLTAVGVYKDRVLLLSTFVPPIVIEQNIAKNEIMNYITRPITNPNAIILNIIATKLAVPLSFPFFYKKKNDKIALVKNISITLKNVILVRHFNLTA